MKWTHAILVALLAVGCDKSAKITYQGTINVDVAGSTAPDPAPSPSPTPGPQPTPQPGPAPTPQPTAYDLNNRGLLLEAWHKLDPIGAPDHAELGPLGMQLGLFAHIVGLEWPGNCYRWTGALSVPADGEYTFKGEVKSSGWLEGLVAELTDAKRWRWTQMLREQDAANAVLARMVQLGLLEGWQHPMTFGITGYSTYRINGRLYGRTDEPNGAPALAALAEKGATDHAKA